MNKSELVSAIAERSGLTNRDSDKAVTAFMETVMNSLQAGERVQLVGFGTFDVKDRPARKGKNPRTGEPLDIPASRVAVFKPGKILKETVNQ